MPRGWRCRRKVSARIGRRRHRHPGVRPVARWAARQLFTGRRLRLKNFRRPTQLGGLPLISVGRRSPLKLRTGDPRDEGVGIDAPAFDPLHLRGEQRGGGAGKRIENSQWTGGFELAGSQLQPIRPKSGAIPKPAMDRQVHIVDERRRRRVRYGGRRLLGKQKRLSLSHPISLSRGLYPTASSPDACHLSTRSDDDTHDSGETPTAKPWPHRIEARWDVAVTSH